MTRENKLALVVGFGLILLVGILISDHFSTASQQDSAQVARAQDPLMQQSQRAGDLVGVNTARTPVGEAIENASGAGPAPTPPETPAADHPEPEPRRAAPPEAPDEAPESQRATPPAAPRRMEYREHHVVSGETLTGIARKYFGDSSLVDRLAEFNGLADAGSLSLNRRLRIPDAEVLRGGVDDFAELERMARREGLELVRVESEAAPRRVVDPSKATVQPDARTRQAQPESNDRPRVIEHKVAEGESLSDIARKYLGSARRYNEIFEQNRRVLSSPDDVQAGMVLRIQVRRAAGA